MREEEMNERRGKIPEAESPVRRTNRAPGQGELARKTVMVGVFDGSEGSTTRGEERRRATNVPA